MSLFEKPIEEMSGDEIKESVEKLRADRQTGLTRPNTKKVSTRQAKKSKDDKTLDKLAALPEDVIGDLFKELEAQKLLKKNGV